MCVVCVVSSVHVCVNGYLVLTGETDAKLSLFHLAVMGVVVELGISMVSLRETWTSCGLIVLHQEDLPAQDLSA